MWRPPWWKCGDGRYPETPRPPLAGIVSGQGAGSGGLHKNACTKRPCGIRGVIVVPVRVIVIDPSFRPTRMAADTVDYEHRHRCAEHERLSALTAGSGKEPVGCTCHER